ncbi:hypothetical protein EC990672_5258A, partial [Escherichia coli 99.0672]
MMPVARYLCIFIN